MEKNKRRIVEIVITSVIVVLVLALGAFSVFQTIRCNELEQKLQSLQESNDNLSSRVESLTTKNAELEKSVQDEREKAEKAQKQLESVQKETSVNKQVKTTTTVKTTQEKVAYLTFDDGPSSVTESILETLKKYDVKATFFVIASSKDTPQRRALMKREVEEGHTIGIHSWSHNYNYIYSSEANFLSDFNKMKDMIKSATGVDTIFSRFPGGTNNTVSIRVNNGKPIMPTLLDDVKKLGYTPVDWNAGGMDAVNPVPNKDTIVNGVVSQCKSHNKAIILLHDSETHKSTAEAVPEIIKQLRAMGFTFKPLTSSDEAFTFKPATKR